MPDHEDDKHTATPRSHPAAQALLAGIMMGVGGVGSFDAHQS